MDMRTMLGAALLALPGGCSGMDGSTGVAVLSLSVSPNPLLEAPCPSAHCGTLANQAEVSGTLHAGETGGIGLGLTAVAMTLRADASGVVIAAGHLDPATISQLAGTAHIAPGGQLAVPVAVHYDRSAGGHPGTLSLTVSAVDDLGHPLGQTTTVTVTP